MSAVQMDRATVLSVLNRILEVELAGVVRYTHYSLMVFGHNRIPIVSWLRAQSNEALTHAQEAGEMITLLGEHPSLAIGPLLETHMHNVHDILVESLEAERQGLELYRRLLELTRDKSVFMEEYARRMIYQEEMHCGEVDKMLRAPGEVKQFSEPPMS
jgi:bacterioferritin